MFKNTVKSRLLELFEMPPYEEKVGNEALSMYNSVNLRVLSTIPTQLSSPLDMQMRNINKQRSFYKKILSPLN